MIGHLDGTLTWKGNNNIIIDVNGVGYQVEVTNVYNLPATGKNVKLFIYTYIREDALKLFGFENMEARELFETLLSVSGIGPKAAMNILSTLSYKRFINAILTENIAVLKEVSGIGPKTAQRLLLELEGKIEELAGKWQISTIETENQFDEELYEALNGLGYSSREIDRALAEISFTDNIQLEEKIRSVLSFLGKESF